MITTQEQLQELISLTKQHLANEYEQDEWVMVDSKNYNYFKQFAAGYNSKKPSQPTQTKPQPLKPPPKPKPLPRRPQATPKKAEPKPVTSTNFERQSLPKTTTVDFYDIQKTVEKHFPHIEIIEKVPENINQDKQSYTDVVILSNTQHPLEKAFLENVAKAISVTFKPASVHKTIIDSNDVHYIISANKNKKLEKIKHIPMLEPSEYLRDPQKKSELWNTICEQL